MLDHMSSTGVMRRDGRRRGEEKVKHEVKKKDIAAVHARYCNIPPPYTPPPPTTLSHEQRLQWCENAKELMDTTIDKWTYPSMSLTAIEDIRNSAKIAAC